MNDKKKEVDIELIYKDLIGETEYSIRELAKKYGVSRTKVENIRDNSKYLVDLDTGEEVLTIKNISIEQQMYCAIYGFMEMYERIESGKKYRTKEEDLIMSKSLNVRLATYLNIKPNTSNRWAKQKKLVSQEIIDNISVIRNGFLNSQKDIMMEFYDSDTLYPKGFKLNYIDYTVKDGFAYYINQQVSRYYHSDLNERDFIHMCLKVMEEENIAPFVIRLSAILGIQLCGWVRMMEEQGYEYEECMQCLRSYERFTKDKEKYEGRLVPPRVIYYETRGFQMLPEEIQWNLIKMKEDGEVAGAFDYNPMMWEIKKLEYG